MGAHTCASDIKTGKSLKEGGWEDEKGEEERRGRGGGGGERGGGEEEEVERRRRRGRGGGGGGEEEEEGERRRRRGEEEDGERRGEEEEGRGRGRGGGEGRRRRRRGVAFGGCVKVPNGVRCVCFSCLQVKASSVDIASVTYSIIGAVPWPLSSYLFAIDSSNAVLNLTGMGAWHYRYGGVALQVWGVA